MGTRVSVLYFSGSGHTQKMAEAVAKGAQSVDGVQVNLFGLRGEDIAGARWTN